MTADLFSRLARRSIELRSDVRPLPPPPAFGPDEPLEPAATPPAAPQPGSREVFPPDPAAAPAPPPRRTAAPTDRVDRREPPAAPVVAVASSPAVARRGEPDPPPSVTVVAPAVVPAPGPTAGETRIERTERIETRDTVERVEVRRELRAAPTTPVAPRAAPPRADGRAPVEPRRPTVEIHIGRLEVGDTRRTGRAESAPPRADRVAAAPEPVLGLAEYLARRERR